MGHQFTDSLPHLNKSDQDQRDIIIIHQPQPQPLASSMDVMVMADSISHFNTGSLSSEDVERLRSLLPPELQQSGKLSHLEIIMEAISYIKMLQNQLGGHSL